MRPALIVVADLKALALRGSSAVYTGVTAAVAQCTGMSLSL